MKLYFYFIFTWYNTKLIMIAINNKTQNYIFSPFIFPHLNIFSLNFYRSYAYSASPDLKIDRDQSYKYINDKNDIAAYINYDEQDNFEKVNIYCSENSHWNTYIAEDNKSSMITSRGLFRELNKLWYYLRLQALKDDKNTVYSNQKISIIWKVKFSNGNIKSCSNLTVCTLTIEDFFSTYKSFLKIFSLESFCVAVSEDMTVEVFDKNLKTPIGTIIFNYKLENTDRTNIMKKFDDIKDKEVVKKEIKNYKKFINNFMKFKGFNIPFTMDLFLWNKNITFVNEYTMAFFTQEIFIDNKSVNLNFTISIDDNCYSIYGFINNNQVVTIKDICADTRDLNTFERIVIYGKKTCVYYIEANEIKNYYENIPVKYMQTTKKCMINYDQPKLITYDVETMTTQIKDDKGVIKNKLIPIAISIYDGSTSKNFFFEPDNWEEGMINSIKYLMKRKYDSWKVYTHNFSYFDSIFILSTLSKLGKISLVMRENKILKLTFKFNCNSKRDYTLTFMDSLLILPDSLSKLSSSFNIETKKLNFPIHLLTKPGLDINYAGKVPEYTLFPNANTNKFTLNDYNKYCEDYINKNWVFKEKLQEYCSIDTIALYQIIKSFQHQIHKQFSIDILKFPTLASIAFNIYRSNYLQDNTIPLINNSLHYVFKQSYYGGITDLYKPSGHNIRSYDVNSLYPFAMYSNNIPFGCILYFKNKGNAIKIPKIYQMKNELHGFFKVKVKAPKNLNTPFLPFRIKTTNGIRTIFPLGTWIGWYYSVEIDNAKKYGYEFEIMEGYLMEKSKIFNNYIQDLYKMKVNSSKNDSKYYIAKLLMNSLYGRFGLNPEIKTVKIVDNNALDEIINSKNSIDITPLNEDKILVSYIENLEENSIKNISIPIASSIASLSRVHMSKFLVKYTNNLYYVDTDGIKVDCELDPEEIHDKELGKMKHEYTLSEFTSLAPKVYGGIYENSSKEIVKIKGYSSSIPYAELKKGLIKDNTINLNQDKWYRNLYESAIFVENTNYTLSVTKSKREIIYDDQGNFTDTKPLVLDIQNEEEEKINILNNF